jgi:adenylate cyclase
MMSKHQRRYFFYANGMLLANLLAVTASVAFIYGVFSLTLGDVSILAEISMAAGQYIDWGCFVVIILFTVIYERPIRKALKRIQKQKTVDPEMMRVAQKRLLNEPYFLLALDFGIWILASVSFFFVLRYYGVDPHLIRVDVIGSFLTAPISVAAAFFLLQTVLQKFYAPLFFPEGGLSRIKGAWRVRISIRLLALTLTANVIPFAMIMVIHWMYGDPSISERPPGEVLDMLNTSVFILSAIFVASAVALTLIVSGNLSRPLDDMIRVLKRITRGDFKHRVQVITNDEIGYTGDVINSMTEGLKERELIRDAFGKYVAREIRDEVLAGRVPLDGERKEVTVLFADIRDFTPMTESTDPKRVVKLLNQYFAAMAGAIQDQGGLILQFLGDEIYAVFGAPIYRPDHPVRAFRAALEMNRRLVDLNHSLSEKNWPTLAHGIGIHTGAALAANIGSPDRLSYLLVGDTINLASRLQNLTRKVGSDMIISAVTRSFLKDADIGEIEMRRIASPPIKGKSAPVEIYALA